MPHAADSNEGQHVLEIFREGMAHRPRAGQSKAAAERAPRTRDEALHCRYMQPQHPHLWTKLPLDLDNCTAEAAMIFGLTCGHQFPAPNVETARRNGNQQAYVYLRDPVGMAATHRPQPRYYAMSIFRRLKAAFDADPNCSGRVMRGLLHPDQHTVVYHDHLYTLGELDELLPRWDTIRAAATIPASAHTSRNYAMFRTLEGYACDLYRDGYNPTSTAFRAALELRAAELLPTLPSGQHPYTPAELRRTITSVIKRVQNNRARPLFVELPRARLWSSTRPQLSSQEAQQRQLEPLEAANRRREVVTATMYLEAARRLLARGEALTARNMAAETGRSVRNVKAHATTWRSVQAHQMPSSPPAEPSPDNHSGKAAPPASCGSSEPEMA